MRPLVTRFGPAAVWQAGLDLLGYPPNWITGGVDFLNLKDALERR